MHRAPTRLFCLHLKRTTSTSGTSPPLPRAPSFLKPPDPYQTPTALARRRALALCQNHRFQEAIALLFNLRRRTSDAVSIIDVHTTPIPSTLYTSLFRFCLNAAAVDDAKRVYAHARDSGYDPGMVVCNRLVDLLAKTGRVADARNVFDEMPLRDPYSWNTLIAAYVRDGDLAEARRVFDRMPDAGKDTFSWSSMMSGYVRYGQAWEAFELYREMQIEGGLRCSKFILSTVLSAATAVRCLCYGKEIHGHVVRAGVELDVVVWSTLTDLYAVCGRIDEARCIFDSTPDRDVVSWTAMMGWYFDCGRMEEGSLLFSSMLRSRVMPNEYTCAGVLGACSHQLMEELGKQLHGHMIRTGLDRCSFSSAALIDMYAKCGSVESATDAFRGMMMPDLVSWTSIISCFAQNGCPEMALQYFEMMQESGVKPDAVAFVGVLSACSHAGLVDKGLEMFHSIDRVYGLVHSSDHYACIVDLLSRFGKFEEANEIIGKMPFGPNKYLWSSLLNGCRIHGNTEYARVAAYALFEIEPKNPATYVTLANIYAKAGRWKDVEQIRDMMSMQMVTKKPGSSW